jgi:subtilisin family serine protease
MTDTTESQSIIDNRSCLGPALVLATFFWIILVSFIWNVADQLLLLSSARWTAAGFGLALIIPPALLAVIWQHPRERSVFTAWALASGYTLLLSPARLFDPVESQLVLVVQLAVSLVLLALLLLFARPRRTLPPTTGSLLLAVAVAALVLFPWLFWGALGSLLDTMLAVALGLIAGLNAGLIIGRTWLSGLTRQSRGRGWDIFTGGVVIGTVLAIIAGGLSFNGGQVRLILALPGLGWLAMALSYSHPPDESPQGYTWRPAALLVGMVTAGVLALTDTDTLSLLAQDQLAGLTFLTALLSMLVGWWLALPALLMRGFWGRAFSPALSATAAGVMWLAAIAIYFIGGHPGLYGDRIFVVLKDQADVSAAANIQNYDERRQFVYTTLTSHANQSQADLRAFLDRLGIEYRGYYLVNAIEVEGGLAARLLLMTRPEVDRILYSPRLRPVRNMAAASGDAMAPTEPQWNLTNIGADRVWNELGVRGAGIVIGQADSGVQWDHPELIASYRGGAGDHDYNWLDPWLSTTEPTDFNGHGTHTLGSIVGQTVGVAPEAEWFACTNLTRNVGNPALYLDCWQFLLAPFPQGGEPLTDGDPTRSAHIINNSWGCPDDSEGCDPVALLPAAQALRAAGIFVEVSAGNDGPACSTVQSPPSTYDEVFSTGTVDVNNNLALFSSTGPVTADGSGRIKPDIMAPGVAVLSAFPNSTYAKLDGTSMAGPHVSGVVALMWSANPGLIGDIDRTEQILTESATPFTGSLANLDITAVVAEMVGEELATGLTQDVPADNQPPLDPDACISYTDLDETPNNIAGYGIVNAYEAVNRALALE